MGRCRHGRTWSSASGGSWSSYGFEDSACQTAIHRRTASERQHQLRGVFRISVEPGAGEFQDSAHRSRTRLPGITKFERKRLQPGGLRQFHHRQFSIPIQSPPDGGFLVLRMSPTTSEGVRVQIRHGREQHVEGAFSPIRQRDLFHVGLREETSDGSGDGLARIHGGQSLLEGIRRHQH